MTSHTETKPWDLSHVLGLINTLSTDSPPTEAESSQRQPNSWEQPREFRESDPDDETGIDKRDFAPSSSSLGDFSRIYQYLGTPLHLASPHFKKDQHGEQPVVPFWEQYASDGATYTKPGSRKSHWQDPFSTAEETVTDTVSDGTDGSKSPTLTKTQRKKLRRKQRKEEEEKKTLALRLAGNTIASESEADYGSSKTPARKASAHTVAAASGKKAKKPRDLKMAQPTSQNLANGPTTPSHGHHEAPQPPSTTSKALNGAAAKSHPDSAFFSKPNIPSKNSVSPELSKMRTASEKPTAIQSFSELENGMPSPSPHAHNNASAAGVGARPPGALSEVTTPQSKPLSKYTPKDLRLTPASVIPKSTTPNPKSTPHAGLDARSNSHHPFSARPPRAIEPTIVRSGEDRNWTLLMKLIREFWYDRTYLVAPMNLTTHNNDPNGIHVFVDASNIFIGFNEQLKRSRGIPAGAHVPAVGLSFDALALLMERRRPVAKRILVGSTPHLPAFDKAKAVGYECSILEKVYKARELTERQIYFQERDNNHNHKNHKPPRFNDKTTTPSQESRTKVPPANNVVLSNGVSSSGYGSGSGSASETNAPQYAPARMIEQGVDEILHLKILESVVDAEKPGTIVLATGDAAQAEYSQGFMAMAQRALKKGWIVELVSWSMNISAMYRRREWTETWGDRFRIVFLDDYAEELLDM